MLQGICFLPAHDPLDQMLFLVLSMTLALSVLQTSISSMANGILKPQILVLSFHLDNLILAFRFPPLLKSDTMPFSLSLMDI